MWLFLANLCGCFLEAFVAVCPKVCSVIHPLFCFGCSKFSFFCAYIRCPSCETGSCHVIQILCPCKDLSQSLNLICSHCPNSIFASKEKHNIPSSFTNDLHKVEVSWNGLPTQQCKHPGLHCQNIEQDFFIAAAQHSSKLKEATLKHLQGKHVSYSLQNLFSLSKKHTFSNSLKKVR